MNLDHRPDCPRLIASAALFLMLAAPFASAGAQADSMPQTLWFELAAGGAWVSDGGPSPASKLAYLVQGGASWRPTGPWAVRAEIGFIHPVGGTGDMYGTSALDQRMMGTSSGFWSAASVLRDLGRAARARSYLIAGAGMAQNGWTPAPDGRTRSEIQPLGVLGAGLMWPQGRRRAALEVRTLVIPRTAGTAIRVPLSFGIHF